MAGVLHNALEVYWDNTLTPSRENEFPLAPHDEVMAGRVDAVRYKRQNRRLALKSWKVMVPELLGLSESAGFSEGPSRVQICGWGLGRDLEWIPKIVNAGFQVSVCDVSSVACTTCQIFLDRRGVGNVQVITSDLEQAWNNGSIHDEQVLVYYAGQFVQNQSEEEKDTAMEHFGSFLRIPTQNGLGRRVYLLHARGEDNPPDKVRWRNTIPYSDLELRAPLEKGFGGPVLMEVIARHRYYHQCYSFLRIGGAP